MRFIIESNRLETNEGELIKDFDCPLEKKWEDLLPWTSSWMSDQNEHKRHCGSCNKCVINFQIFNENQIKAIVKLEPDVCGHLMLNHPDITEVIGSANESKQNEIHEKFNESSCTRIDHTPSGARIVRTARTIASIKNGISKGYVPYFSKKKSFNPIHQKLAIIYDNEHHALLISGDFRSMAAMSQQAIEQQFGNGSGIFLDEDIMRNPSPIAAYLLPANIVIGEKVYLEDLIEDLIESEWNQGDTYRVSSSYAIWRGADIGMEVIGMENKPLRILG